MAHRDTGIAFSVGGLNLRAVGFLNTDEQVVREGEMLTRAVTNGWRTISGDEDATLARHLNDLPSSLRGYNLIGFHRADRVSCFADTAADKKGAPSWKQFWDVLEGERDAHYLVLLHRS